MTRRTVKPALTVEPPARRLAPGELEEDPRVVAAFSWITSDFRHPKERNNIVELGPGYLDLLAPTTLMGESRSANAWDSLPPVWPDFAAETLIASAGNYVRFSPFPMQRELIEIMRRVQNVIVLKSRQTGVSECVISSMLHNSTRRPAWTGVVFSKTREDASELAGRIKVQASTLRDRCPPLTTDSKHKLAFMRRGTLFFLPPTPRSARGIPSASQILFDEAAFVDALDKIETGAMPTMSMLGDRRRAGWVSTPNGNSGSFYDHWNTDHGEVVIDPTPMGKSGHPRLRISPDRVWAKVCIHYSQHPVYGKDPSWAANTKRKLQFTQAKWDQEYELDFTASGADVFSPDLVEWAEDHGSLQDPRRNRVYVLGIDPNGGGDDYFCAVVVDVTEQQWHVVAGFAVHRCSRDYGLRQCVRLLDEYDPIITAVEKNGVGAAVAEALDILRPSMDFIEITTSRPTKIRITDRVVLKMEQHLLTIPPGWFLGEQMRNFREDGNGGREAAAGHYDDAVMALSFAGEAAAHAGYGDALWIEKV